MPPRKRRGKKRATGEVNDAAIGAFGYDKVLKPGKSVPCRVDAFLLRVAELKRKYPEDKMRSRKWFKHSKAALRLVAEPELRGLLMALPVLLDVEPAAASNFAVSRIGYRDDPLHAQMRQGARLESWFQSAAAFDALQAAGHISCSLCGEGSVTKALMAPAVAQGKDRPALGQPQSEVEAAMAALRRQVEENSE